jgi:hypothetical protein|uniref:Uncharacterized protein n=1 Tax=Sipha flava TaxID=143950 RepID=A0A2S2QG77_9HEMI
MDIENHLMVQYSPILSKTFNVHINVEFCSFPKSIKYICKYRNKGSGYVVFQIENINMKTTNLASTSVELKDLFGISLVFNSLTRSSSYTFNCSSSKRPARIFGKRDSILSCYKSTKN